MHEGYTLINLTPPEKQLHSIYIQYNIFRRNVKKIPAFFAGILISVYAFNTNVLTT